MIKQVLKLYVGAKELEKAIGEAATTKEETLKTITKTHQKLKKEENAARGVERVSPSIFRIEH